MSVRFILLSILVNIVFSQDYPFRDPSLPWDERVEDLVNRLTIDEIVLQLAKGGTDPGAGPAPAIPRLGINPYGWNTECLHGDANSGPATAFPQSIGLAATFSYDVVFRMAEATGLEVRAKYNNFSADGLYGTHKGLSCFSPVINIMRHPLWGRVQETYGEDPYLSGQLAKAYVQGLQGNDPRYIRANAGCKHFDVYSGPENIPQSSFSFNAVVSDRDWKLTYQPAFETCVKAGTYNIMCSFNSINGVPACANRELLTDILRTEWGFTGYVISDENAIEYVHSQFNYFPDSVTAAAGCIKAGCNLELSSTNSNNTYNQIGTAIAQGILDEQTVRDTIKPLFYTRMRLGEFDPPSMNPYVNLKPEDFVQSPAHQSLALEFAMKSYVLLNNSANLLPLPLDVNYGSIAVVGPMADNPDQIYGTYAPDIDYNIVVTPYAGLRQLATVTNLAWGCSDTKCVDYDSASVLSAIATAEIIFICIGTGPLVEAEGNDRSELTLPGQQATLVRDVIAANTGNVPIVLLLYTAGPVQLDDDILAAIPTVVQSFFPAQTAGTAIYKLLRNDGDFANPAGRLPYTWPRDLSQVPEMTDYAMVNRTYRYWNQSPPTYPFGYGLSYTTFTYSDLTLSSTQISVKESVTGSVRVKNVGSLDGEEVIQCYISWLDASEPMPRLQMISFDRVLIPAGSTYIYEFIVSSDQMAVYIDGQGLVVQPGRINIYVGGQQPFQKTSIPGSDVLQAQFTIG
ncbi:hypothetical protein CHUAL_000978 [Chamberlinius hualienensis]